MLGYLIFGLRRSKCFRYFGFVLQGSKVQGFPSAGSLISRFKHTKNNVCCSPTQILHGRVRVSDLCIMSHKSLSCLPS